MVESRSNARHCHRVWLAGVILLLASFYLYLSQPMDSASGNLEAFSKDGFTVGWIIQPHRTELRAGDIIQQIEGQPINQWFKSGFGTISGSQTITYSVNRHGESIQLEVLQTPIDLKKNTMVLWIGLAAGLLLMAIGAFLLISLPR